MNKPASLVAAAIIGLLLAGQPQAWAQDDPQPGPGQPPGQPAAAPQAKPDKPDLDAPVPADQLEKARKQAEFGMGLMPTVLAGQLDLTDAQKESAKQILQDRWNTFGKDQQDKLFSLMIQSRQLVASGQGTAEDFQKLSKLAQPIVESSMKMLNDAAADFANVLDDKQKEQLKQKMADFQTVQDGMLARVKQVADGTVKLGPDGQPDGGWTDEMELQQRLRRGGDVQVVEDEIDETGPDGVVHKVKVKRVKSKLPDEKSVAGDEKYWVPYLKGYIAKYSLDDDQQKTARRLTGEALRQASEVRKRTKGAFDDARAVIKEAEAYPTANPGAVEAAHLAYDQLNRPVVTAFHDLQRQLDNLLTAQQRENGKNRGELFGTNPANDPAKDKPKAPAAQGPTNPDPKPGP